jgi:predicted extracellular nuclease
VTAVSRELAVATFNVENLAAASPQTKFDRLAGMIVHNLAAPDLIALEEIQDNDGATDDGVVAADQTLTKLVKRDHRGRRPALHLAGDRPTSILTGSGAAALTDLPATLPVAERYTYDYEGSSEVLDHILLSPALLTSGGRTGYDYDVVHVNCELADQASDHDPQVVRLLLP